MGFCFFFSLSHKEHFHRPKNLLFNRNDPWMLKILHRTIHPDEEPCQILYLSEWKARTWTASNQSDGGSYSKYIHTQASWINGTVKLGNVLSCLRSNQYPNDVPLQLCSSNQSSETPQGLDLCSLPGFDTLNPAIRAGSGSVSTTLTLGAHPGLQMCFHDLQTLA